MKCSNSTPPRQPNSSASAKGCSSHSTCCAVGKHGILRPLTHRIENQALDEPSPSPPESRAYCASLSLDSTRSAGFAARIACQLRIEFPQQSMIPAVQIAMQRIEVERHHMASPHRRIENCRASNQSRLAPSLPTDDKWLA